MSRYATALDGIAAITSALVYDDRQLDRILDDTDTRDLARLLAEWCAEALTHAAAHGCSQSPTEVLRQASVRYAEDEEHAA